MAVVAVTSMEHRLSSIWSKSSPLRRLIKGDPSQPMARMIPLRAGKVQTGCAIYAAPAGCSSCFLSFYLTEYDVSDLIIVTSVVGHGPLCTTLASLPVSRFLCPNMERLKGVLDYP